MARGKRRRRILITGCSGFIGRHAVAYALKNGYQVVGLDLKELGVKERKLTFIKGSINERKTVERAAKGCDMILHLAAMTSLPDFQYDLHKNYTTNVLGFMNVIEAARKNNCRKFAYASSSGLYQESYSEDSVIDVKTQRNHYGKSKLIDEMIADSYIDSYNLKAVGLRYFNVYGPGEGVKERPSPIYCFLKEKKERDTVTIFGDGKQAKDFIYIDDVIRITFRLMEDAESQGVYNVGTGVATSFNNIAALIKPGKIKHIENPYTSSYIFYLKADTKRLLKALRRYRFISIKEGISMLQAKR